MTPEQLRAFRHTHQLTQSGLGVLVGRSSATITKWERSVVPIPSWVEVILANALTMSDGNLGEYAISIAASPRDEATAAEGVACVPATNTHSGAPEND